MSQPDRHPARQAWLREHNLALILGRLVDEGPTSRARLAAATGLTRATVSSLVDTLISGGLVAELAESVRGGSDHAPVGRPGTALGPAPRGPVGIGLEINVDYLATCTVDLGGTVRDAWVGAGDLRGRDVGEVLDAAAAAARTACATAQARGHRVAGVAVAVPGLVDGAREQPVLRVAPNLGWRDVPVLEELRRRRPRDVEFVRLENEANFGALGELWCGGHQVEDQAVRSFVHVSGEIGVGAGVVLEGELLRGRRGFAGEIGHLEIRPRGPRCPCGQRGCLEQFAGQEAILRAAGLGTGASPAVASATAGGELGSVARLVSAARTGEPQALSALTEAGAALGSGLATMVKVLDVEVVVLGGLYAAVAPWVRAGVERELARRVLSAAWAPVHVLVGRLGSQAAVRGAAVSVVRELIADPAAWIAANGVAAADSAGEVAAATGAADSAAEVAAATGAADPGDFGLPWAAPTQEAALGRDHGGTEP